MMLLSHRFLALGLASVLSFQTFAEAPVVDDSENFAMLDEQQAVAEQPAEPEQLDDGGYPDEDIALVQDHDPKQTDNAQLLDKLQGMKQEIQELRGQLEVQAHELKQLQQQQLAFYKDIDTRLSMNNPKVVSSSQFPTEMTRNNKSTYSVKPTPIIATPKASNSEPKQPIQPPPTTNTVIPVSRNNPANEQLSYLAAYELVKNKQFEEALTAMQQFAQQYPQGGYTANAHYWLGELHMVKKNCPQAINHFEIVLKQFPSSSKAAACTLKIGYALAASGKEAEAKQRLQQVLKNYPDTPTAQLAVTKLQSLNAS